MKKLKINAELEVLFSKLPKNLEFVNDTEKAVCAWMWFVANDDSNHDGVFQMPMTTLTNNLGICRKTASIMVASLVDKGYFEVMQKGCNFTKNASVYKSHINAKKSIYTLGDKSIYTLNNNYNKNNNEKCKYKRNDNCKRNKKNKLNNKNNVSHKSYDVNATQQQALNNYMKVEVKGNILEDTESVNERDNCMNNSIISNVEVVKVKDNTLNATPYTYEDNTYNSILEDITNAVQERYTASDALNYSNTTNHSTAEETTPYSEDNNGIALIDNSTLEDTESVNERDNCMNNSIIEDNAKEDCETLNGTDNNKDKNTTAMEIEDYQLEAIEDYINSKKGITYAKFYVWLQERVAKLQSKKQEWQFNSYAGTITAFVDNYYPKVKDKKQEIDYFHELVNATVNYLRKEMFAKAKETPDAFIAKLREVKQAFNTASGAFLELKNNGNDVAEVFCNAFDMLVKVFAELEQANKDYEEFKQVAPYNPVNSSDFRINEMRTKFAELRGNVA